MTLEQKSYSSKLESPWTPRRSWSLSPTVAPPRCMRPPVWPRLPDRKATSMLDGAEVTDGDRAGAGCPAALPPPRPCRGDPRRPDRRGRSRNSATLPTRGRVGPVDELGIGLDLLLCEATYTAEHGRDGRTPECPPRPAPWPGPLESAVLVARPTAGRRSPPMRWRTRPGMPSVPRGAGDRKGLRTVSDDDRAERADGRGIDEPRPAEPSTGTSRVFAPGSVRVTMGRSGCRALPRWRCAVAGDAWLGQGVGDRRVLDAPGLDGGAGHP